LAGKDIARWTLEIPEDVRYPGIATFIPGYLGIKQSSRSPRNAAAQEGIPTLTYSPSRDSGESPYDVYRDPQSLHVTTLQAIAADLRSRKDEIRTKHPNGNQINVDRKTLICHSMGGLAAPRYAISESWAVEAIHGLATVGFGHPTLSELAVDIPKGTAGAVKHELLPAMKSGVIEINMRNLRDIFRYYSRLRVLFEGLSCLGGRVIDDVEYLSDRDIPYHYMAYGRDILVRADSAVSEFVASHTTLEKYGHLAPQAKADIAETILAAA
jgi:hypothetical protein